MRCCSLGRRQQGWGCWCSLTLLAGTCVASSSSAEAQEAPGEQGRVCPCCPFTLLISRGVKVLRRRTGMSLHDVRCWVLSPSSLVFLGWGIPPMATEMWGFSFLVLIGAERLFHLLKGDWVPSESVQLLSPGCRSRAGCCRGESSIAALLPLLRCAGIRGTPAGESFP